MGQDPQFVTALSHGLDILRCFTPEQPALTNSALSRITGIPRSSISRLTHTLVKVGFLEYDGASGAYRLGLSVLSLQPAALAGTGMEDEIAAHLHQLAERIGTRVLLTAYESYGLTVVQRACTNPRIPAPSLVGCRYALPRRAMGRAYMAACAGHEQEKILNHLAQGDDAAADALHAELDGAVRSYRDQGYCTSLGESRPGNHSISVMVNLAHLGRRFTLSCGGPADDLPQRVLHGRIAPALIETAGAIEKTSMRMMTKAPRA